MERCLKIAEESARGRSEDPMWDHMAQAICPPTYDGQDARETMAKNLIGGLGEHATLDQVMTVIRLAEALQGIVWVNLYTQTHHIKM